MADANNDIQELVDAIDEIQGQQPNALARIGIAVEDLGDRDNADQEQPTVELEADASGEDHEDEVEYADQPRVKRPKFDDSAITEFYEGRSVSPDFEGEMSLLSLKYGGIDIISGICQHIELLVELGKYLGPEEIITLYSVSRKFHYVLNNHLHSSICNWVNYQAPEAGNIFNFKYYRNTLAMDPLGRTREIPPDLIEPNRQTPNNVRLVAGIKYLQMVLLRSKYCREILAMMARNGHRMPKTMYDTLLRIWVLMDIATTRQRISWLRAHPAWTNEHLYNAQMFFVKLTMHFNDPIYSEANYGMVRIFLGQQGLYPLWELLMGKRYRTVPEIMTMAARYEYRPHRHALERWGSFQGLTAMAGVPIHELGKGHLEGWGMGINHLGRPDELITVEAVRRGLYLDEHLEDMAVWGYIDWKTGENIVPTEEEIRISDSENEIVNMDKLSQWRRKHALKKRWNELTEEQRDEIVAEERDDALRAMIFCVEPDEERVDVIGDSDDERDNARDSDHSLEDEITRGFQVRPRQPSDDERIAPRQQGDDENLAWREMVHDALAEGISTEIEDEEEPSLDWDWKGWLGDDEDEGDDGEYTHDEYYGRRPVQDFAEQPEYYQPGM